MTIGSKAPTSIHHAEISGFRRTEQQKIVLRSLSGATAAQEFPQRPETTLLVLFEATPDGRTVRVPRWSVPGWMSSDGLERMPNLDLETRSR